METDRSDVSDKAERKEREREAGRKKAGGKRGMGGRWRGMTSPSFRPSVFPAAGEEKLADEARDERRARHDGGPKGCGVIPGILC